MSYLPMGHPINSHEISKFILQEEIPDTASPSLLVVITMKYDFQEALRSVGAMSFYINYCNKATGHRLVYIATLEHQTDSVTPT
jgi:hypothetical protein